MSTGRAGTSVLLDETRRPARLALNDRPAPEAAGKVTIVSDHDYRTARRASLHQITDALVRLGHDVTFISVRFSPLSWLKGGDSRMFLWQRANTPEMHNGVRCYLWKTPFHPFHPKAGLLNALSVPMYRAYAHMPSRFLDDALRSASSIIVESGLGVTLMRRARRLNKSATIAYRASDELRTVGVHPFVQARLEQSAGILDQACVTSRQMAASFRWAGDRLFFVPHGIRKEDYAAAGANPYEDGRNAVSVGSMLFDPEFFAHAAARFPDVKFHVIGAGMQFSAPGNVIQYPEMPFRETLPYVRHANLGVAPYRAAPDCEYISDTSMKLLQYEYCGLPAVCPAFAAGDNPNRFGYTPGDPQSIAAAIEAALAHRQLAPRRFLGWEDIARRILNPRGFADTTL